VTLNHSGPLAWFLSALAHFHSVPCQKNSEAAVSPKAFWLVSTLGGDRASSYSVTVHCIGYVFAATLPSNRHHHSICTVPACWSSWIFGCRAVFRGVWKIRKGVSLCIYIIKAVDVDTWLYCKIKCHFIVSASYCMSQKTEKPVLSGQRIKTRKRGELWCFCSMYISNTSYSSCTVQAI
jgi:hypothetical protein